MNKASRMLKRFLCLLVVAIVILFSPIFDRVVNFLFDKDIPLIIISPLEDKVRGIITLDILVFDTRNPIKVNIQLKKKKGRCCLSSNN
ncbi:hypothetical protein HKBW3C_03080 [Candidatus Hakubella thermalkaliphila]|nr:hypothetical protein HKBW3C_03080 [Candidatus Hakubella thermalkaliphila]